MCCCHGPNSKKLIEYVNSKDGPKAIGPYSHGVIVDLSKGKLLFVSGQLPINPATGEKVESSIQEATKQTLDNLAAVLKAAGTDFDNIVRVDVFLKSLKDFAGMNEEYGKRFKNGKYPARQTVEANIPAIIEISCIAAVKD
ncbi:MAG: hypothetical protein HZB76_00455 [Chlamydiae bacterium]|nr:hypothetical protein [Chlamydiota bacterium]